MTQEQYIAQNALGFEGDGIFRERMKEICKQHKISTIIETGTYRGATTKAMAEFVKLVLTVENNKEHFDIAQDYLMEITNVGNYFGSSVDQLPAMIKSSMSNRGKLLFFLDAHWGDHNPLLEELKIIADNNIKAIIVIHDFEVPGHPELGFDVYGPIKYDWSYIRTHVEEIYGVDGYTVEYNDKAEGAKRGVIFIFPK